MTLRRRETSGDRELSDFQKIVSDAEGVYGPVQALGKSGANNFIDLEILPAGLAGDKCSVLEEFSDFPKPKAGYKLICVGECLVKGADTRLAVYRKP